MILSVTPNSAVDHVIFIDEFRPGTVMRATKTVHSVGGKGLDASVVLRCFGVQTVGMTFAAGVTGRQLVRVLRSRGVVPDVVWVKGETRVAQVVVETRHARHSHIMTGVLQIAPDDCEEFIRRYRRRLAEAKWVVIGGSLPPALPDDFYLRLVVIAQELEVPCLVDGAGPPILEVLPGLPAILKMNRAEFAATFGGTETSVSGLQQAAEAARATHGLPALVLTLGKDGILAVTPQQTYLATAPAQEEINAAGSGDAVSAALAWRFSVGDNWPSALRWAAAAGAATVLTEGTADCCVSDVQRILQQTAVRTVLCATI